MFCFPSAPNACGTIMLHISSAVDTDLFPEMDHSNCVVNYIFQLMLKFIHMRTMCVAHSMWSTAYIIWMGVCAQTTSTWSAKLTMSARVLAQVRMRVPAGRKVNFNLRGSTSKTIQSTRGMLTHRSTRELRSDLRCVVTMLLRQCTVELFFRSSQCWRTSTRA